MRRVVAPAVAALVIALVPAAAQAAPSCGDVVTQDTVLTASMTGCDAGLVVGADGVTINLNGYSIEGVGTGVGISSSGHAGVTIINGTVRGFGTGVRLSASPFGTVYALQIRDTGAGIRIADDRVADSLGLRVVGNTVATSSVGLNCLAETGESSPPVSIADNVFTGNGTGISLVTCPADLVDNTVSASLGDGIVRFRSPGLVDRNVANANGGHGINSIDSHATFSRNVTNRNGGDGLRIRDAIAEHGPFHTVQENVANANGGYGISTTLEGVIDGGRNRAHGNGETAQCQGVVCNER